MEELSASSTPEDDDDEENTKAKKKGLTFESFLSSIRKSTEEEKTAKDIGKSIFGRLKLKAEDKSYSSDLSSVDSAEILSGRKVERNKYPLSPEEEFVINRSIAEDHLANLGAPETTKQVTDFLESVAADGDPEAAYEATTEANGWPDDVESGLGTDVKETDAHLPLEYEVPLTTPNSGIPYERTLFGASPSGAIATVAERHTVRPKGMDSRPRFEATAVLPTMLATDLAAYIIGKRVGRQQASEKLSRERQRLTKQVAQLEKNISNKEQRLQQLSKSERMMSRREDSIPVTSHEKTIAIKETQQKKNIPQRIEHLGQTMIAAEVPNEKTIIIEKFSKPNSIRDYYRPENIKTLRRRELLELSEKIKVEGASLRDMFDNGLFGERALRRLVGQYIKGKDVRLMLRREIIEKQIDFERDPFLRDHGSSMTADLSIPVFDRMLEKSLHPEVIAKPLKKSVKDNKSITEDKPSIKKSSKVSPGQLLLSFILLLILIIIFLLRKGH